MRVTGDWESLRGAEIHRKHGARHTRAQSYAICLVWGAGHTDRFNPAVTFLDRLARVVPARRLVALQALVRLSILAGMTFSSTWHNLLENVEVLPSDATFVTPLSGRRFA